MSVSICQPVTVVALFEKGSFRPIIFRWQNRKISIDTIEFTWQTTQGRAKLFHFSAATAGAIYELVFNNQSLGWMLQEVEEKHAQDHFAC